MKWERVIKKIKKSRKFGNYYNNHRINHNYNLTSEEDFGRVRTYHAHEDRIFVEIEGESIEYFKHGI